MIRSIEISRHRVNKRGKEVNRSSSAVMISQNKLDFAGVEGEKFSVRISLEKKLRNLFFTKYICEFIFKEYPNKERAVAHALIYHELKKLGYFVPQVVRVVEEIWNKKIYLLMSDVRQRGRYKVYGWSGLMSSKHASDLMAMNLDQNNLYKLEKLAEKFIEKTVKDKVFIKSDSIHLFYDTQTNEINFGLLDLNRNVFAKSHQEKTIRESNSRDMQVFLSHVKILLGMGLKV